MTWTVDTTGTTSARRFDGGLILLQRVAQRLYAYDGRAARLWEAVSHGEPTHRTGLRLAEVDALLAHWREEGLIGDGADPILRTPPAPIEPMPSTPASRRIIRLGSHVIMIERDDAPWATALDGLFAALPEATGAPACSIRVMWRHGRGALLIDGAVQIMSDDPALLIGGVQQALIGIVHGEDDWLAVFHAAAVAIGNRAVVLPAASGSGKTTLTAYLAQDCSYLGEDVVALGNDRRVAAWPVPLHVKRGSRAVLAPYFPDLARFDDDAIAMRMPLADVEWQARVPLRAIVFPRFDAGTVTVVEPVTPLAAFVRLINDRVWIGHPITPARVDALLDLLSEMRRFTLSYSDLRAARVALGEIVAA